MELKKKWFVGRIMDLQKNDGYSMKIYMIIRNYGIGKKYWLSDELWICKEKNDGYSLIIYIIMTNYGIEKKDG